MTDRLPSAKYILLHTMHELSLAASVAEIIKPIVSQQPNDTILSAVEVEVGTLAGVEIDTFTTALHTVLQAEGFTQARVDITVIPGEATCLDCETTFKTERRNAICPKCGSGKCLTARGTELRVSGLRFKDS